MAAQVRQASSSAGALQDLVKPICRQRPAVTGSLEHDKQPLGRRSAWPLLINVGTQRAEEARGDRHDPLPTSLTLGDEQPPLTDVDVGQPQPKHLATSQPAEQ